MAIRRWARFWRPTLLAVALRERPERTPCRRLARVRLALEPLECRTLLSHDTFATAVRVEVQPGHNEITGELMTPTSVDIYQMYLPAGADVRFVDHPIGQLYVTGGYVRIFDSSGAELFDTGGYPYVAGHNYIQDIAFRESGYYYVGISSYGSDYDPKVSGSTTGENLFPGPYGLSVYINFPELHATHFSVAQDSARWGDRVTIDYRIENSKGNLPGGEDPHFPKFYLTAIPFDVTVRASTDAIIDYRDPIVGSFHLGQSFFAGTWQGFREVTLPAQPPAGFAGLGPIYLGLQVDAFNHVAEDDETNNANQGLGIDLVPVTIGQTFQEAEPNDAPAHATPFFRRGAIAGSIQAAGDVDYFAVRLDQAGRLTLHVAPDASASQPAADALRLSLYGPDGSLLLTSDADAFGVTSLVQHLPPGAYSVAVSEPQAAGASYRLTSDFLETTLPFAPLPINRQPFAFVTGDFNNDGVPDMATAEYPTESANLTIYLGVGDGTFCPPFLTPLRHRTDALTVAHLNGDGNLDLVTINTRRGVSIKLGHGDGTFDDQVEYNVPFTTSYAVATDLNGDDKLDLAVVGNTEQEARLGFMVMFLGDGQGGFQRLPAIYPVGRDPATVTSADVNEDGIPDLITANGLHRGEVNPNDPNGPGGISVLLGHGDGTFDQEHRVRAEGAFESVLVADLNTDGHLDLYGFDPVFGYDLLLGDGHGNFSLSRTAFTSLADLPTLLDSGTVLADFNQDGIPDRASTNILFHAASPITVSLGLGAGQFQRRPVFGMLPYDLAADINGDGHLDLLSGSSVMLGLGDGTFSAERLSPLDTGSAAAAGAADFNGDGRQDLLVSVDTDTTTITSIDLGLGDGTFRQGVVVGDANLTPDLNRDGTADLVAIRQDENGGFLASLLGRGDGTFQDGMRTPLMDPTRYYVGPAGDFNSDGFTDLVIVNYEGKSLGVMRGRGDGTFSEPMLTDVGSNVSMLFTGDFNGDGKLDLLADGNVAGQTKPDVLFGQGDGTFRGPMRLDIGDRGLETSTVGDFNGDGLTDVVLLYRDDNPSKISLRLGQPDGTFLESQRLALGIDFPNLTVGDFNEDGRLDLCVSSEGAQIFFGRGEGTLVDAGQTPRNAAVSNPLLADLDGNGAPDAVVLARSGNILLRRGRAGDPTGFDSPVLVNPGQPARSVTLVNTGSHPFIAAVDQFSDQIELYAIAADGTPIHRETLTTGSLPVTIASGELHGDGLGDLVVANALPNTVAVYFQQPDGSFRIIGTFPVGVGPSQISLQDINGKDGLDILVTNQISGDVSVLLNAAKNPFTSQQRFRATSSMTTGTAADGAVTLLSDAGTFGLIAGQFNADDVPDLLVLDPGRRNALLLSGDRQGGFSAAQEAQSLSTGNGFRVGVAGRFSNTGFADLALLDEETATVRIYRGDGHSGFMLTAATPAGNLPTGLTVADFNQDGKLDLLVGNEFGDLLILLGNGDGTFQSFTRADQSVALAVADLNGDGKDDFVFANPALDHVSVEYGGSQAQVFQSRQDGLLTPGAVTTADMNADGIPDLIVANGGGNEVLVYLGLGNAQFGARRAFPVGTAPAGLTVQDLNGDGLPDLIVANQGSNDVSILTGKQDDTGWTLEQGTRFPAGTGPVSTTVVMGQDAQGNTIPASLLVTNSGSNNVYQFNSRGGGFFNLTPSAIFSAGNQPQQSLVGDFNGDGRPDLVALNQGSNNLTFFSNFGSGVDIATGGSGPVAALAGDFNRDGVEDLIVAHNGNGLLSFLTGTADGPSLAASLTGSDLQHPTALSMARMEPDGVDLYVAQEGRESVERVSFPLHFGLPGPVLGPDATAPAPRALVADLAPLADSDLALVATLLTGSSLDTRAGNDSAALTDFILGLEHVPAGQAFNGRTEGGAGLDLLASADVRGIIDEVFRRWLPALSEMGLQLAADLAGMAQELMPLPGAVVKLCGVESMVPADRALPPALKSIWDGLLKAGVSTWKALREQAFPQKAPARAVAPPDAEAENAAEKMPTAVPMHDSCFADGDPAGRLHGLSVQGPLGVEIRSDRSGLREGESLRESAVATAFFLLPLFAAGHCQTVDVERNPVPCTLRSRRP